LIEIADRLKIDFTSLFWRVGESEAEFTSDQVVEKICENDLSDRTLTTHGVYSIEHMVISKEYSVNNEKLHD